MPGGSNFAIGAGAEGSTKASGSSFGNVIDGNTSTYWTPITASAERIAVKFIDPVLATAVIIREPTSTVNSWTLVNGDNNQTLATGTYLGNAATINFAPVSTRKLSLSINTATAPPMISEFEVYGVAATSSSSSTSSSNSSSSSTSSSSGSSSSSSGGAQVVECFGGMTIENKSVDCGGKTIGLACNADSESQPPVIILKNASVKNLRIAKNGGSDGIHCVSGNCTAENVVWEDICEDAATHKSEGGTFTIIGGSAYNDAVGPGGKPDKIFQHNSKNSTFVITGGFTAKGENGKLWRSCGDCSNNGGPRRLVLDNVRVEGKLGSVAGANGNYGDTAKMRNLFIQGYKTGTPKICDEYIGIEKGTGSSSKIGEMWNTSVCDVSRTDVMAF